MKTLIPIVAAFVYFVSSVSAHADIVGTVDTFDTGITSNGNWAHVGTTTSGGIVHDAVSAFDGGVTGGDTLNDDGGLRLNTANATVGDEAIGLTIGGTMVVGEQITFSYGLYNDNSSFNRTIAQLYNLTDGTVLAQSGIHTIDGTASQDGTDHIDAVLNYTALASDVGDQLQIRFVEQNNNTARDLYVDNYSVTSSVPEPSSAAFLAMGLIAAGFRRKRSGA